MGSNRSNVFSFLMSNDNNYFNDKIIEIDNIIKQQMLQYILFDSLYFHEFDI